jgi:hypothetical protein
MGRRDRAWPHHLSSLTGFCSARPQARKNFTHDSAFVSGCPVSAPDPVFEIAGEALSARSQISGCLHPVWTVEQPGCQGRPAKACS